MLSKKQFQAAKVTRQQIQVHQEKAAAEAKGKYHIL